MKRNNYEPNKTFNVFNKLGFEHISESDNEFVFYLYHPVLLKEIFIDRKDEVDYGSIQYQLDHIGFNDIFFDSLYDNL